MTSIAFREVTGFRPGMSLDVTLVFDDESADGLMDTASIVEELSTALSICDSDDVHAMASGLAGCLRSRTLASEVTVTLRQSVDELAEDDALVDMLHATGLSVAEVKVTAHSSAPVPTASSTAELAHRSAGPADVSAASSATSQTVPLDAELHHAIVGLESTADHAEELFRASIVAVDSIPGNQIEGISPLYHASALDGLDSSTAVLAVSTTMNVADLVQALHAVAMAHEGIVKLTVLAFDGKSVPVGMSTAATDAAQHTRAAFLSPWMDMDPMAELDGSPLAFLIATAADTPFVGLQSDRWIVGEQ